MDNFKIGSSMTDHCDSLRCNNVETDKITCSIQNYISSTPTDTRVVSITVTDTDPYTAAEIANAVRDIASKHIQQVMDIKAVNVVETANIPDEPSSPSVPKNGVIGGLLGILLAAAVVIIVYLTNDTVKTPEDVEKYLGLSVLGTIPYSSKMGKKSKKKKKRHA